MEPMRLLFITTFSEIPGIFVDIINDRRCKIVLSIFLQSPAKLPVVDESIDQGANLFLMDSLRTVLDTEFDYVVIASDSFSQIKTALLTIGVPHKSILPDFQAKIFKDFSIIKCINDRERLVLNKKWSIISNNCVGGLISKWLGLPFYSPFVGMHIYPRDFVRLMGNFNKYMNSSLRFIQSDRTYPVAKLRDIYLYFNHYKTINDVVTAWVTRSHKIDKENLLFILSLQFSGENSAVLNEFNANDDVNKIIVCSQIYANDNIDAPNQCKPMSKEEEYLNGIDAWIYINKLYDIVSFFK